MMILNLEPGMAAANDLQAVMQGSVLLPDDKTSSSLNANSDALERGTYNQARSIWNGAVQNRPALIALCETVDDVQAAVRVAGKQKMPLSVRGGGHDWAGRALRHDGLVIDLTRMRSVKIDPGARVATVSGGATGTDVIVAAAAYGFVAVTGTIGAVGMAGLTLGGGYGLLSPRYGLALDNLLGADIVLADGRRITTDADHDPNLFWALRGGGGNFGVITSMRIRLHEAREMLAGTIVYPLSQAATVLQGYAHVVTHAPDELGVLTAVMSDPAGNPGVVFAPLWSGEPKQGMQVVTDLQRLGTPLVAQIGPTTYSEMLAGFDGAFPNGRGYEMKTRWLPALTPDAIAAIVAACSQRTSPLSAVAFHHFRGAPTRVPNEATAFGLRREHFLVEIIAAWDRPAEDDGAAHRRWARDLWNALAPFALPGGYPNLLESDNQEQIARAYGGNAVRLKALKQHFDPDNVFMSAIPLP